MEKIYEKASETEIRIITPQEPNVEVRPLAEVKERLAALEEKRVNYPLEIQKQIDTEMAGVEEEIAALTTLVEAAERLKIVEEVAAVATAEPLG